MKKILILTSFKSRKKQKMILEEILIVRANNGKLFHPNKIFIPFYISKDVILDVLKKIILRSMIIKSIIIMVFLAF